MANYLQRKSVGGLSVITTKNTINISDDSLDSPIIFDKLKYLHFIKSLQLYLFTNPLNDLFALFIYEKKVYYFIIQRNVNQFHSIYNDSFFYVIGTNHTLSIYSFESIMNRFMDNSLDEDIEEITAVPGSPTKRFIRMPFEDLSILNRSISQNYNNLEYYENFMVIKSEVNYYPELFEITILNLVSSKSLLFRIEKIRDNIIYNNNTFSFYANEGELKNSVYIITYFDEYSTNNNGNITDIMNMYKEELTPHYKTATLYLHD